MRKPGISGIWMVIHFIFIFIFIVLIYHNAGWAGEWIQINPTAFRGGGEAARSFQEAVFDNNYLYVVTSDTYFRFDCLHMRDPNRRTILWTSSVYEDPNEWKIRAWEEVWFDEKRARVDRLFTSYGFVYAGLFNEGNCRIYRFSSPNQKQDVIIDKYPEKRTKWRVDHGEVFVNNLYSKLYIAIYEKDYGARILRSDSSYGPIKDEINADYIQASDPNIKISLLRHIGERLFVGTKKTGSGALLSYTSNGNQWSLSGQDTFKDPNDPDFSNRIGAFLSIVEFMGQGWLLTEFKKDSKKQWALWKTGISSGQKPQWEKQISSQNPNGPFFNPNIVAVSVLQPIGEYLYLACLCNDGGEIWKSYRGENEGWICVPSPSEPDNRFGPGNLLSDIFFNPDDIDHVYAGTKNDKGAQILTRLAPRMDISNLTMEDRFIGPEKDTISMIIRPNWEDPDYWRDPNHLPSALVYPCRDPNALQKYTVEPNKADFTLWDFDPNIFEREGIYNLKWELFYGKDKERVVRYLSFAWDSNSPSAPKDLKVGEGDGRLEVQWEPSIDSLHNIADFEDTNFRQSIMQYELKYWPEGKSDLDKNIIIPVGYPAGAPQPNKKDISGLQNYTIYHICVRARDKAHNVSEWSEEVTGIPQPTLGLLDLLDEKGGCFISSVYSRKRENANTSRRWLAGLKVGGYEPVSEEVDLVYGEDRAWPVQIEIGWIHRPYLEVSLGTGYMKLDGMAIKILTGEKSIDPVTFHMIPCPMTFRWIPFQNSGHVLTPYLGGGINAWWYQEEKPKGKDKDGWNFGYHGLCGIRLLLDQFDPKHARFLEKDFGVMDTYLTLEVVYNWINNFGDSRLDLGGTFYQVGILFLF